MDVMLVSFFCYSQVKEFKRILHTTSLKDLKLDEAGKMSHTYKTLGAGFWALKQKDFKTAIRDIVMEVSLLSRISLCFQERGTMCRKSFVEQSTWADKSSPMGIFFDSVLRLIYSVSDACHGKRCGRMWLQFNLQ